MMKTRCSRFTRYASVLLSVAVLAFWSLPAQAEKGKTKAKSAEKDEKKEGKTDKKKADTDKKADKKKADTEDDILGDDDKAEKKDADDKTDKEPDDKTALDEKEKAQSPAAEEDAEVDAEETADAPAEPVEEEKDAEDAEIEEDAEVEVEVLASSDSEEKKGFFPTEFDGDGAVRRDRGINILTARATRPMALTLVIDYRPYTELAGDEAEDVFFDYLGLDGGNTKLGLGLRFGIIEGLDVGLYRLSDGKTVNFDTYEFDVRYAFLKQEKHFIDMSARAGFSWFAKKNAKDKVGGYGEIFIDRVFLDMLFVGAGFQIHSHSHNDVKRKKDDTFSGAVLGVIEWRMIKQLALTAEVAAAVVGYGADYGSDVRPSFPSFSMGLKVLTRRHTFAFLVSNSQFINADGIVSNSWRDFSDIVFGFQFFREFNFK